MGAGFLPVYSPPGEVNGLRIAADQETLSWDPERSVGFYSLYSGALVRLRDTGDYGNCVETGMTATSTTDTAGLSATGDVLFYLITAKNRLGEEGTMGWRTGGLQRLNDTPCP
jgi:hypothetical protein